MNKELLKVLTLCKYIALGCLTTLIAHWLCGDIDYVAIFLVGFAMSIAVDVADLKHEDD